MKFTQFLTESTEKTQEIQQWFHDHGDMFTDVRHGIHWNSYDESIHLSSDLMVSELDTDIPYNFVMCAKDFELNGGKVTKLPFGKHSVVLGKLVLKSLPELSNTKNMPSFVSTLELSKCSKLKTLTAPVNSDKLEIKSCENLTKISDIHKVKTLSISSCQNLQSMPKISEIVALENLTIYRLDKINVFTGDQIYSGVKYLVLGDTAATSFKGIEKTFPNLTSLVMLKTSSITSHVLGVLLLNNLTPIEMLGQSFAGQSGTTSVPQWLSILNKHLGKGRQGIMDCQRELIDAGFENYAKL